MPGTSRYNLQFTRYADARRVVTAHGHIEIDATDFADAYRQAELMLRGMKLADPNAEFDIATISADSYFPKCELDPRRVRWNDPFAINGQDDPDDAPEDEFDLEGRS